MRPTKKLVWATDTNYTAGADPWDGTATKVDPSAGKQAQGVEPGTAFPSQEYNAVIGNGFDWRDYLDDALHSAAISFKDDFCGSAVDTGKWSTTGAGITTVNDGFGSVELASTSGDTDNKILTRFVPIGTANFRLEVRVRYTTLNTGGRFFFGFMTGTNPTYVYSDNAVGSGRWQIVTGVAGGTVADLTDAPSNTFQTIVIERKSGVLKVTINGTERYSATMTESISGCVAEIEALYVTANLTLRCDYMAFSTDGTR